MARINIRAILLIVVCTVFTSLGQILWKYGVDSLEFSIIGLVSNVPLIAGFLSYGIGLIFLVTALKYGDLSFLYPFIALSFVWVGMMSYFLLGEPITALKWIAIAFIIVGVSLIGIGGHRK